MRRRRIPTSLVAACVGLAFVIGGVDGGADIVENLTGTSFSTPVSASVTVNLNAGANTIKFHNGTAYAPDLDVITVS
jgi:hypothetical protein